MTPHRRPVLSEFFMHCLHGNVMTPVRKIDANGNSYYTSCDLTFYEQHGAIGVELINHTGVQVIGLYEPFDAYRLLRGREKLFL